MKSRTSTSRLVANGELRDERRDGAVALAPAGTGRTTVDGGRSRSGRGRTQQGSHSIFVGEDARETLDASIGAGAALEHVEGLGPGRGRVDHLGSWSGLRTRKRGRVRNCGRVGCDGRPVEGKKGDEIEGDEGFPGGGDDKLRGCRSGVDNCCDVDIKRSEALRAGVEEAVGGEDWHKGESERKDREDEKKMECTYCK
jgi:hypothetical protein